MPSPPPASQPPPTSATYTVPPVVDAAPTVTVTSAPSDTVDPPDDAATSCPIAVIDALTGIVNDDAVVALRYSDRHYRVLVCSDGVRLGYYGLSRSTHDFIALPAYRDGDDFEADNGNVRYLVGADTLTVFENGSQIYRAP